MGEGKESGSKAKCGKEHWRKASTSGQAAVKKVVWKQLEGMDLYLQQDQASLDSQQSLSKGQQVTQKATDLISRTWIQEDLLLETFQQHKVLSWSASSSCPYTELCHQPDN